MHRAHNARSLKLTPNEPTAMQPVESEREREGVSEQNRKAAAVLVSSRERLNERRGEERKGRTEEEGAELRESNEGGRGGGLAGVTVAGFGQDVPLKGRTS